MTVQVVTEDAVVVAMAVVSMAAATEVAMEVVKAVERALVKVARLVELLALARDLV